VGILKNGSGVILASYENSEGPNTVIKDQNTKFIKHLMNTHNIFLKVPGMPGVI
jgi:hypothetical protein